jgi:hypothetical protein
MVFFNVLLFFTLKKTPQFTSAEFYKELLSL